MANPTSNFNWQMPTPTDLVTDLPADFEVFGQAVDSSMADLLGGTTGQILAKNSNTNMDFVWTTPNPGDITGVTAGTGISGGGTSGAVTITNSMATEITAKGDLIVGTGNATFDNLPAGTNGHVLTADSTVSPTGLKWAASSGDFVLIKAPTTFTNVANTGTTFDDVFSSTYISYLVVVDHIFAATAANDLHWQWRVGATTRTTSYYTNSIAAPNGGALVNSGTTNSAEFTLTSSMAGALNTALSGTINVTQVSGTADYGTVTGMLTEADTNTFFTFGGKNAGGQDYTGFILKSSSSNITGKIAVYGVKA
jgi:hypothetical protein